MQRRVLHTADLHLISLGDSACHSLEALVDLASKIKVDMVIIAGDLFDHNGVDDDVVSFAVERLGRLPVQVVILPGNHDCLSPDSVFKRTDLWKNCANVRVFGEPHGETLILPDLGVSVWGKPICSDDGNTRPLSGIPRYQEEEQWYIAVAHGYYGGIEARRSLPITREEIITSRQHYIALGHCPAFSCVCDEPVKAYYCDSPSVHGTVNIVDLAEEAGVQVTRYSL